MQITELIEKQRATILIGKNGSGKSTVLRKLDQSKELNTKYISPERGGTLKYDPNVDLNISNNESWLTNDRRKNRTEQFRQQSTAQFRNLEVLILREIESDAAKRNDHSYTFDNTLSKINNLLPNIKLVRADRGFKIEDLEGNRIAEDQISSGEAELIALAIEVLVFSRSEGANKYLLLDEPDVHLHPDLQQRFVAFIYQLAAEFEFRLVIATHSTAIIGALSDNPDVQISVVQSKNQSEFKCFPPNDISREIIPVFGSHPLSSQFNSSPILLVEGEDDRRIIEQTVRSSGGNIQYNSCVVGNVDEMNQWETWLNEFLPAIYDSPSAYSIRDLDTNLSHCMEDSGVVVRSRLNCYSMENLLVCDQSLSLHSKSIEAFVGDMQAWLRLQPSHQYANDIEILIEKFDERRTLKLKNIRNILVAILGSAKPWEVIVGQLIANRSSSDDQAEHSLNNYLGIETCTKLFS